MSFFLKFLKITKLIIIYFFIRLTTGRIIIIYTSKRFLPTKVETSLTSNGTHSLGCENIIMSRFPVARKNENNDKIIITIYTTILYCINIRV